MPITKTERMLCESLAGEAFRAFDRWCKQHDPDGNMDIAEAAIAYSDWASKNSIAPYLDAAKAR